MHDGHGRWGSALRTGVVGVFVGCSVSSARAEALAGAELLVERTPAATDCPDAHALAATTHSLGSAPREAGAPLRVAVSFDRDLEGYFAEVRASGRKEGTRSLRLSEPGCTPLAHAVSVVIAVLVDLVPPEATPEPVAAAAPLRPEPAHVERPVPEPSTFRLGARLHSSLAYGLLGSALSMTVGGTVFARFGWAELGLGGFWVPDRQLAFGPGVVEVGLSAGTASGCGFYRASRHVELGGCAELSVGALHGEGRGFDQPGEGTELWIAAGGGGALRVLLNRSWAVRLGLEGLFPLKRQSFSVGRLGEAFYTMPAAVAFELGPELTFW